MRGTSLIPIPSPNIAQPGLKLRSLFRDVWGKLSSYYG